MQLSSGDNAVNFQTGDSALGYHIFDAPTPIDRLRVRLVTEDEEVYNLNGVPWSMALSIL